MTNNFYFLCIPNHTYLKLNFEKINPHFLSQIKKRYKYFIIGKKTKKNHNIILVKIFFTKEIKLRTKIFYLRKDFGVYIKHSKGEIYCYVEGNIYSFDSMLRLVFSWILFNNNGLFLHSAGIVCDNKSYLFVGRSGRGKSTLIKNSFSKKNKILSDELIPIISLKNRFFSYLSPFWGELESFYSNNFSVRNKLFEVKNIYILNKHIKNFSIKELSLEVSVRRLLKNNLCVFRTPLLGKKIFATALDLAKRVKIYSLDFNKNLIVDKNFLGS